MHEPDRHAHQLALHCTALAEVAALADGLLAAADHVKVDVPSQLVTKSFLYSLAKVQGLQSLCSRDRLFCTKGTICSPPDRDAVQQPHRGTKRPA